MKNNPAELMGRIRIDVMRMGDQPISLRDDIYPIAVGLQAKMDGHKSSSPHSVSAAVRCTMQRLVKEKVFIRLRRGLYLRTSATIPALKGCTMSKPIFRSRDFTLAQVLSFKPYAGQRNTEKHAAKWLADPEFNRKNPTLGHTIILASFMSEIFVIDGNTQILLHKQGEIVLPDNLPGLHLYICSSEDQLLELYNSYNDPRQSKQAGDKFYSAAKLNNIKTKSAFMSSGRGTSAVAYAEGARLGTRARVAKLNHVAALEEWRSEIIKLDGLMAACKKPGGAGTNAGILAAALLTFRKAPAKAAEFWKLYYEHVGEGSISDPWLRLYHKATTIFSAKGGGREATLEVIEVALAAFEHCADDVQLSNELGKTFKRVVCDSYLPETRRAVAKAQKSNPQTNGASENRPSL